MDEPTPSGRELEILKVLWETGPATVRQVHRRLCPNNELAFNTVQTLLRIMDDKGLVSHQRRGRGFVYTPHYSRQHATGRFLQQVFDGAMDQVVVNLLGTADLRPEELRKLEEIVAEARRRLERNLDRQKRKKSEKKEVTLQPSGGPCHPERSEGSARRSTAGSSLRSE